MDGKFSPTRRMTTTSALVLLRDRTRAKRLVLQQHTETKAFPGDPRPARQNHAQCSELLHLVSRAP